MFEIRWTLFVGGDVEEFIDPCDLLGSISITLDAQSILEENTYLDTWLTALIEATSALLNGQKHYEADTLDEPHSLIVECNGSVEISYAKQSISGISLDALVRAIYQACKRLLEELNLVADVSKIKSLRSIHKFVEQYENGNISGILGT